MPTQLRLQPYQLADLRQIRDLDPSSLQAVRERLQTIQPIPMQPKELHREIADVLGNPEVANHVLRPLLSLYAIIRQRQLSADDILEGIRHGIEHSAAAWTQPDLERWGVVAPIFKDLLLLPAVRVVATALDLSYEYQTLLQAARVVTDIRPVFDLNAEKVEGAVVTYTLRLRYDSAGGDHSLSVAIDERDVRELERQCKRALKKAQAARALMQNEAKVRTIISGEGSREER